MVPPFCSTSCLQMLRPKPRPSEFISAVLSNFPNIEKSLLRSLFLIPIPVSLTLVQSSYLGESYQISTYIMPFSVNFKAFFLTIDSQSDLSLYYRDNHIRISSLKLLKNGDIRSGTSMTETPLDFQTFK